MSKNIWKLRHKLRNGQNFPPWSPNFTNKFILSILQTNKAICPQIWDNIIKKRFFSKLFFFCENCVTNCVTAKRALDGLWNGQMKFFLWLKVTQSCLPPPPSLSCNITEAPPNHQRKYSISSSLTGLRLPLKSSPLSPTLASHNWELGNNFSPRVWGVTEA